MKILKTTSQEMVPVLQCYYNTPGPGGSFEDSKQALNGLLRQNFSDTIQESAITYQKVLLTTKAIGESRLTIASAAT